MFVGLLQVSNTLLIISICSDNGAKGNREMYLLR